MHPPTPTNTLRVCAPAAADGKDAAKGKANWDQLVALLDEAEVQLGSNPFLAGQAYSAADVMFTPVLFRLGVVSKTGELLKPRPNVSAYFDR
jgi:glutathione S-transferase